MYNDAMGWVFFRSRRVIHRNTFHISLRVRLTKHRHDTMLTSCARENVLCRQIRAAAARSDR